MKTSILILSIVLFINVGNSRNINNSDDKIFFESIDPNSDRKLIVEEDVFSVWVYVLKLNNKGIDFDGFLCSVVNPKALKINLDQYKDSEKPPPLNILYANEFSYVENLIRDDIKVNWEKNSVEIKVKEETYLIMDLVNKLSYSKSLSIDCPYGKTLVD